MRHCILVLKRKALQISSSQCGVGSAHTTTYVHLFYFQIKSFYQYCSTKFLLPPITSSMQQSPSSKFNRSQQVKNFFVFYSPRKFITAPTTACHVSLSWARSFQSTTSAPICLIIILILSSHLCLGLPSGLFLSGFPTNTLYVPLLSSMCATYLTHLIFLDLIV